MGKRLCPGCFFEPGPEGHLSHSLRSIPYVICGLQSPDQHAPYKYVWSEQLKLRPNEINVRKSTFENVHPAEIQISLRIRVWSESFLGTFWIAKDAEICYLDNKDWSDYADAQTDLILIGHTCWGLTDNIRGLGHLQQLVRLITFYLK